MKRIVVYILSLAAAMMVPLEGTDVGKLHPVELVQIYKEGDLVVIVTDTGVGIVCFDDTVQNILTVFALIQGKVVFFQLVR